MPGIQNYIDATLQLSLDPEKEQEYIDKLRQWEDFDDRMKKLEKQSAEILKGLKDHGDKLEANKTTMRDIVVDLDNVKIDFGAVKQDVKRTAAKTKNLTAELEKEKKKTDSMQADQGK